MPDQPDRRLKNPGTDGNWDGKSFLPRSDQRLPATILARPFRYSVVAGPEWSSSDTMTASWTYRIHIQDVFAIVPYIRGYATWNPATLLLNWQLPITDPDGYGFTADSIANISYVGSSGYEPYSGVPLSVEYTQRSIESSRLWARNFAYADIKVNFNYPPYQVFSDSFVAAETLKERLRFMVGQETPSSEYVSLQRGVIYWNDTACPAYINEEGNYAANTPKPVASGAGIIRNISEFVVTWYRVPHDAYLALRPTWKTFLSCVNDASFSLPLSHSFVTFDMDTLMFQPWRTRPRMGPYGSLEYDVEFHFIQRSADNETELKRKQSWQKLLFPDGNYYTVGWKDDSEVSGFRTLYPRKDFTKLFTGG